MKKTISGRAIMRKWDAERDRDIIGRDRNVKKSEV